MSTIVKIPAITASVVLILTGWAAANTKLDIDGQIRSRSEVDDRSFSPFGDTRFYTDLRTRLGIRATIRENTEAYIQFQDSRRLGGGNQSGTLSNEMNVDVHQAYVRIKELWNKGPSLTAGRFELNLGNQRVFGAVGWSNVGRSWEGFQSRWSCPDLSARVFVLVREQNPDFYIFGTEVEVPGWSTELLAAYEKNRRAGSIDDLDRFNLGLHYRRVVNAWDFETNAVYQFGQQRAEVPFSLPSEYFEQDISAYLFTFEAGYSFDNGRVAGAIDYSSGDDAPTDDTYGGYNNLYYTGHKFRGHMDYFIASQPEGLVNLIARGQIIPAEGWELNADVHFFRAAADFDTGLNERSKKIGTEIDLYVSTSRIQGANLAGGASVFMPSDEFAGRDADPGYWLYAMLTVGFSENVIK